MATSNIMKDYIAEVVTLAENVTINAGATSSNYNIPQKTGYDIANITPLVGGAGWGFLTGICGTNGTIYFRNSWTSNVTATLQLRILYIKH